MTPAGRAEHRAAVEDASRRVARLREVLARGEGMSFHVPAAELQVRGMDPQSLTSAVAAEKWELDMLRGHADALAAAPRSQKTDALGQLTPALTEVDVGTPVVVQACRTAPRRAERERQASSTVARPCGARARVPKPCSEGARRVLANAGPRRAPRDWSKPVVLATRVNLRAYYFGFLGSLGACYLERGGNGGDGWQRAGSAGGREALATGSTRALLHWPDENGRQSETKVVSQ